ncbi:MAG: hypothetical protein D6748_05770 [Calditrichaeota bacterium]|nr:MAG: hypothetical protein D6748_05770 [Calditrichota bacterium]
MNGNRFPFLSSYHWMMVILLLLTGGLPAQKESSIPFYPNGVYDESTPTPSEVLGFAPGERPARYAEAVHYLRVLAEKSPRVLLVESGKTHEGRTLYYALISSEENLSHLEDIKQNLSLLADPRSTTATSANTIIEQTPAVVWLMYSIHGDELSGADASLQMAYQLAAGEDSLTRRIRQELVVGIDPMENPDGRERFLAMMQQWNGQVPNPDVQSMHHTGVWPWGRTNHYLFDLNRDWFILSQPESRARMKALREFHPQVVVDAHEMGAFDTYLFPPAREPINPNFNQITKKWGKVFSREQAAAFDRYGWSYYTREWLEDWYPGYGSSIPFLLGAVGILYEQAGTDGSLVKRPDGTILTYRQSVHHQFVSSMANVSSAAKYRKDLLQDFYKMKREELNRVSSGPRAYLIVLGENPTRAEKLVGKLLELGIEVKVAEKDFRVDGARSFYERVPGRKKLPAGTYIVNLYQPLRPLIKAILEFDPRMTTGFLKWERESLERGEGTRLYEVTAWSMLMAYNVEAYETTKFPSVSTKPVTTLPVHQGSLQNPRATYGFLINGKDDRVLRALVKMLEADLKIRVGKKSFTIEGNHYPRGSLLLRCNENTSELSEQLQKVAAQFGIRIVGVNTALSDEGPDLGGNDFRLLTPPRIAMVGGPQVSSYNLGAIWYFLDYELHARCSIINSTRLTRSDLRKYNVLILPSGFGYKNLLGKGGVKVLKEWVSNGGTLIAVGNAAAFVADSSTGLSKVKLKRQALSELSLYELALQQEMKYKKVEIDSLQIWEGKVAEERETKKPGTAKGGLKMLRIKDSFQRRFMPRGAILNVELNERHWLTFGLEKRVPAIFYSSYAYLSRPPVETPARFSGAEHLRLSGLLWPEAKLRWQHTAYATREGVGKGQIILFAGEPNFRSYFYGTARMLFNAIFLGPGMGTRPVMEW